ncbi:UbiA family prenyltransferase [Celeribacter litoreus]|uniref:UbiA family prenyltransferase n=1 Tax=Celeribacter litoreus TaxID=2876714 RepID=UPI001CCEDE3A|nr:UbiA family prenyltransferase [Celeribacter litoreus]MCA0042880.1 UbiA family prenyltransferase [Celeribacter litoreus]
MSEPEKTSAILAVDLDGTLLKSDMLYESFWSAASQNWRSALRAVTALADGKAALKRALAQSAPVDVETLPYNAEVLAYIANHRAEGGQVALVTATDQDIADRIAAHLGVFDAVYGSDGQRNLKGDKKAAFLVETYGEGGFVYMGDHEADLAVWPRGLSAVTVNAPEALREKAATLGVPVEHLGSSQREYAPYLKALRPHQWLKNILVFLPMMLAQQFTLATVAVSLLAFVAFSLVASSVYVLNDLLDLSADRAHPRKCKRPFAAGSLPIAHGSFLAAGLFGGGLILSLLAGPAFLFVLLSYYAMTTAYSFYFKRRMVIDICVLAGLYTMRIVAGGVAAAIPLSMWLLAFSIFLFFALAAVKRQAELVDNMKEGKLGPTGRGYHVEDLAIISQMAIGAGYISVLVLALYMNSDQVVLMYPNPEILWGICLVLLFWVSWIVMKTHRGEMHDDPIIFAVKDRISRICGLLVVGFILGGVLI